MPIARIPTSDFELFFVRIGRRRLFVVATSKERAVDLAAVGAAPTHNISVTRVDDEVLVDLRGFQEKKP